MVVICLTLPNDLSRYDVQDEARDARRISPFSLARYLFGAEGATTLFGLRHLELGVTARGLELLEREVQEMNSILLRVDKPPPLIFFTYGPIPDEIVQRLAVVRDSQMLLNLDTDASQFIPGDGHPNGVGNRTFAKLIANAIDPLLKE